ncbi:hypothetical protein F5X96DRAFT_367243 [Biscogniauxia mediterranea]|nr:hypothetical protein F5X96DRAFT_367243 [Biscogniauxia mediterranea]
MCYWNWALYTHHPTLPSFCVLFLFFSHQKNTRSCDDLGGVRGGESDIKNHFFFPFPLETRDPFGWCSQWRRLLVFFLLQPGRRRPIHYNFQVH